MFSLATLAAVLAYATFFESWYGTAAVQEWIYRSKGFAILLAFLGTNILCAALIRYPLEEAADRLRDHPRRACSILLAGSWNSVQTADEGQVGDARRRDQGRARPDRLPGRPRPQARPARPRSRSSPSRRSTFRPGNFAWGPGQPRPRACSIALHTADPRPAERRRPEPDRGAANTPDDPFRLVVKSYLPASMPRARARRPTRRARRWPRSGPSSRRPACPR